MYLLFMAPTLILSLWASFRVKRVFARYSKVQTGRGLTGAEAALGPERPTALPEKKLSRS